jgi:3-oxoacyl-[acyl-carrier protein] reductase
MTVQRTPDLAGKTAVITGAFGAIGKSITQSLLNQGAHVVLLDLADAPHALSGNLSATCMKVDLSDQAAIAVAAGEIKAKFGTVDILVNNAGILSNQKMDGTSLEEWHKVNAVNVDAAFLLSQAFLPGMRKNKWGRIVNVSSYAAKSGGLTAGTAYSVSKSALIGLTFSIARETAGEGVTSNAIAPAYVMSPMISEQLTEEQRQRQLAQIPVGRFCEPEEVAHTVEFLISPLAGFITGEVIDMNGGLHFD